MTKVFLIQGISREIYYNHTLDYIHAKYHTHSSNLLDIPFSESDKALISQYEAYAQHEAQNVKTGHKDVPLGKVII